MIEYDYCRCFSGKMIVRGINFETILLKLTGPTTSEHVNELPFKDLIS